MSRRYDNREPATRRIVEKGSFRRLLGGLAILALGFVALAYLVEWISLAPIRSYALESARSVPFEPPVFAGPRPLTTPPAPQKWEAASLPAVSATTQLAEHRSRRPSVRNVAAPVLAKGGFWVQVGAFKEAKNAARLAARLTAELYPAVIRRGESAAAPHVVWVGKYPSLERAEAVRAALERNGLRGFILRDERP